MGGRGRGRGSGLSLNTEFLGLSRGDLPPGAVSPPPLFPHLSNRPPKISKDIPDERLLVIMRRLGTEFRAAQDEQIIHIDWNTTPKELKIGSKKRRGVSKPRLEKRIRPNLEERLHRLEANEKEDSEGEENEKKDSEDEEKKEEGEEELEEEDEEMDGGTDYANNYFDNGEEDDEDDNLDEGGVY